MPKICAATSDLDTYRKPNCRKIILYLDQPFFGNSHFSDKIHPKSERRRRGGRNASVVCRPPGADAYRRGLSQPPGAYARHYGSLWRAQRARAPCMTRSTGRLVALPVQKATCNTSGENRRPLGLRRRKFVRRGHSP